MKLNLDVQNNTVKKVDIEMTPVEFMLFRQILNLAAIHTNLNELDGLMASRMYNEIEEYLKEKKNG